MFHIQFCFLSGLRVYYRTWVHFHIRVIVVIPPKSSHNKFTGIKSGWGLRTRTHEFIPISAPTLYSRRSHKDAVYGQRTRPGKGKQLWTGLLPWGLMKWALVSWPSGMLPISGCTSQCPGDVAFYFKPQSRPHLRRLSSYGVLDFIIKKNLAYQQVSFCTIPSLAGQQHSS